MTVKELIAALEKMPPNAMVFSYSVLDECDARVDKVKLHEKIDVYHDEYGDDDIFQTPYYCQGDSQAEQYWHDTEIDNPVVFLIGTDKYVTYN